MNTGEHRIPFETFPRWEARRLRRRAVENILFGVTIVVVLVLGVREAREARASAHSTHQTGK